MNNNELTDDLKTLLKLFMESTRPLSARRIATKTGTYPATARRRVEALIGSGVKIKMTTVKEGKRGFESEAWVLDAKA